MNIYLLLGIIPYAALLQPVFYHFNSRGTREGVAIGGKIVKVQGVLIVVQTVLGVIGIITALGK